MSHRARQSVFCLVALALFTAQSQLNAGIIMTIQPHSASTTRVIFSDDGDTTVSGATWRIDDNDALVGWGWDFEGTNVYPGRDPNLDFTNTGSLPTFDVDGTTYYIHGVGAYSYQTADDTFSMVIERTAVDTDADAFFDFAVGATFSDFTGTGIINESWDNFLVGSHSTSMPNFPVGGNARLPVTMVVNPEPGSLLIGGITGVGMAFGALRRRRRQRQVKQQADAPETAV